MGSVKLTVSSGIAVDVHREDHPTTAAGDAEMLDGLGEAHDLVPGLAGEVLVDGHPVDERAEDLFARARRDGPGSQG